LLENTSNAIDTGSTITLRADLEQTAIQLDDQLVAVAQLTPSQRQELVAAITTTVESVEAAVGRYAAATTSPNTSVLDAVIARVQRHFNVTKELQPRLAP
jgi:pyridoxine 5'-phosphate synthase PdxJ